MSETVGLAALVAAAAFIGAMAGATRAIKVYVAALLREISGKTVKASDA